jgi:hypothetical protein
VLEASHKGRVREFKQPSLPCNFGLIKNGVGPLNTRHLATMC